MPEMRLDGSVDSFEKNADVTWCNLIVQNTLSGAAMDRDATKAKAKRSGLKRERTVGPNGFFRDELPDQILKREHIDTKNKVILPCPPSDFFLVGLYLLPIFPSWYEIFRVFSRLRSLSFHTLVHIFRRSRVSDGASDCPGSGLHEMQTSEQGLQVR